jgi:hypothetical protein
MFAVATMFGSTRPRAPSKARRRRDPSASLGMTTLHRVVTFRVGPGTGTGGDSGAKARDEDEAFPGALRRSFPLLKQGAPPGYRPGHLLFAQVARCFSLVGFEVERLSVVTDQSHALVR